MKKIPYHSPERIDHWRQRFDQARAAGETTIEVTPEEALELQCHYFPASSLVELLGTTIKPEDSELIPVHRDTSNRGEGIRNPGSGFSSRPKVIGSSQ